MEATSKKSAENATDTAGEVGRREALRRMGLFAAWTAPAMLALMGDKKSKANASY